MLALIPLAFFIVCVFLFWNQLSRNTLEGYGWREAFLAAAVVLGVFVAASSEGLSLLKAIYLPALSLVWLAGLFFTLALLYRQAGPIQAKMADLRLLLRQRDWSLTDRIFALVLLLFTAILFLVARLAPPNTNDSLGYHMSRVMHWIQNQGLAHYATPIDRQLWMPPWAEMAVMQLYLFKGDDGLSNLVQLFSMGASLVVVSLIAKRLGASVSGQLFAALFCVTIPMGILQATSTQTDYATAFWLVSLGYYALLSHQRPLSVLEWVLLSLAVALGVLTKGTFYIFAFPFLVWLLVSTLRRGGWKATIRYAVLGFVLVGSVNAGVWARNMVTYEFPLGPRESIGALSNETLSLGIIISNLIRNSTLHLGTPYGVVNGPAMELVEAIHKVIGIEAQDPRSTLDEYRIKRYLHEDRAGNPIHFLLIPVTLLLMLRPTSGRLNFKPPVLYALLLLSSFFLFSAVYKWQSTGSRLLLPFFVAWAPLAGIAFERLKFKVASIAVAFMLIAAAVQPLISNPSRALLPLSPGFADLLNTPRAELLFANWPEIMPAYLDLAAGIQAGGCKDVGIKFNPIDAEYPLWFLLASKNVHARIEHLDAPSPSGKYAIQGFHPCAIVCTYCMEDHQDGLPLVAAYQGAFYLYSSSAVQGD